MIAASIASPPSPASQPLPLSLPLLATLGLFAALAYWNDWYNTLLFITKDQFKSLQYFLQEMLNSMQALKNLVNSGMDVSQLSRNLPQETLKMAMTMITTGPIILLYPFVQRFFLRGQLLRGLGETFPGFPPPKLDENGPLRPLQGVEKLPRKRHAQLARAL